MSQNGSTVLSRDGSRSSMRRLAFSAGVLLLLVLGGLYTGSGGAGSPPAPHFQSPASPIAGHAAPAIRIHTFFTALHAQPWKISNTVAWKTGAYQQKLVVDSATFAPWETANLTNIFWTYASNGTNIPAWLENGTTSSSIATIWYLSLASIAKSPAFVVVDEDFASTSTTTFCKTCATGEAPNWTATYGAYDNGLVVFPMYDNFAGTSLNTYNWVSSFVTGSATINNGLTTTSTQTGHGTRPLCGLIAAHQNISGSFDQQAQIGAGGYGFSKQVGLFTTFNSTNVCSASFDILSEIDLSRQDYTPSNIYGIFSHTSAGNNYAVNTVTLHSKISAPYLMGLDQANDGTHNYANTSVNDTPLNSAGQRFGNLAPGATTVFGGIALWSQSGLAIGNITWWRETAEVATMPSAGAVPLAPTGFSVTSFTGTTVSLGWTNPPGTLSNVTLWQWTGSSCSGAATTSSLGVVTTATASSLSANTTYSFQIAAFNSTGMGLLSSCATQTTLHVPFTPTGLSGSHSGSTTIVWTWNNPPGTLTNATLFYQIGTVCKTSGFTSAVSLGVVATYSQTVTANQNYIAVVQLWNATGASAVSNCYEVAAFPNSPTGLTLVFNTISGTVDLIKLSWTNPVGPLTNLTVFYSERSTCAGATYSSADSTGSGGSTSDTLAFGFNPERNRVFVVVAYNATGASSPSSCLLVNSYPNIVPKVSAVPISGTAFKVYWTTNAGTYANYTVFYGTGLCNSLDHAQSTGGPTNQTTISGVATNLSYQVGVQAWNSTGAGLFLGVCATVTLAHVVFTVPITVTNHKPYPSGIRRGSIHPDTGATGTYEQNISLDSALYSAYFNSNLSNWDLTYSNGTPINTFIATNASVLSTNTLLWANLSSIPASSSITLYLQIYPKTSFFWNALGPIGVRPDFDATHYGAWDDGAVVFYAYWEFGGSLAALPGLWGTTYLSGAGSFTSTYYQIGGTGNHGGISLFNGLSSSLYNYQGYSTDVEAAVPTTTNTSGAVWGWGWGYAYTTGTGFIGAGGGNLLNSASPHEVMGYQNNGTAGALSVYNTTTPGNFSHQIYAGPTLYSISYPRQGTWNPASCTPACQNVYFYQNGSHAVNVTSPENYSVPSQSGPFTLLASSGVPFVNVYWADFRSMPTFGVFPSVFIQPPVPTPKNLSVIRAGTTYIYFLWNVTPTFVSSATIRYGPGSACSVFGSTISGPGPLSLNVTALSNATTYCFEVAVTINSTLSAFSLPLVASTLGHPIIGAPYGLGSTGQTTNAITLTWFNPSGVYLTNDTVWWGPNCTTLVFPVSTAGARNTLTVNGLAPASTYCFSVQAWQNRTPSSNLSNAIYASTLANGGSGGGPSGGCPANCGSGQHLPNGTTIANGVFNTQADWIFLAGVIVITAISIAVATAPDAYRARRRRKRGGGGADT